MKKQIILTSGLLSVTALCGVVLSATVTKAEDSNNLSVVIPVSCTMSGSGTSSHTANIPLGTYSGASGSQYENGIGKTTLTTYCTDTNGFAVYAVGYTGDADGTNIMVGATSGSTINTKVYESTDTNSNWSMKVTKVTDSAQSYQPQNMAIQDSFDSWHTVPDTYAKVAEYHATSGSSATDDLLGAKLETTYATYIANSQAPDTYTSQVKYVVVHPYNATAPVIPTASTCNTPVQGLTYMQDLNSSNKATILANMETDEQYFLKDKRDDKTYCVSKLRDGNIWMTQNLDHDIVTTQNYYTNENTDIGWNSTTNSYDTATWTAERATYPAGTTTWDDYNRISDPTGVDGYNHPESYDPGELYIDKDYLDGWSIFMDYVLSCRSGSCNQAIYNNLSAEQKAYFDSCDTGTASNCDSSLQPSNQTTPVSEGVQNYHMGNYYNWTASIAINDSSSYSTDKTDANRSICPANWTLPKDGNNTGNGSIAYLINQYSWDSNTKMFTDGSKSTKSPFFFNVAGQIYNGTQRSIGGLDFYWTSVVQSPGGAYNYYSSMDGIVNPSGVLDGRGTGNSIRCVTR